MQIDIIKCLPAIASHLWFVHCYAYTGNRDELVFLLFFSMLYRFTFYEDFNSSTQLLLQEVELTLLRVVHIFNLSDNIFSPNCYIIAVLRCIV